MAASRTTARAGKKARIGLIGMGAIGSFLASHLRERVAWVCDLDEGAAKKRLRELKLKARFVKKPEPGVGLVVECASQAAVQLLAGTLKYADAMILSVGALTDEGLRRKLEATARRHGHRIYIPSGAIGGLDALKSCGPHDVLLETRKPPASLGRSDSKPTVVFEGSARAACKALPKSVNVSATLAIAGIGFEKTRVRVISDPAVKKNMHTVRIKGETGAYAFVFENNPLKENPRTSALAARSALRLIEELDAPLQLR
ncbi:MAG: aspartate dehydrogenase [Candidatus Burarchaeum sp.]|nr:aspartate dehydrogenase [Candidatus Burarchaeum sp.]MDO8340178.1 aspartate dehydrogenase [Candidatus Burarchaeum sp.]